MARLYPQALGSSSSPPATRRANAPHQQTRNCRTIIKILSQAPDGCFIPRQTGGLTVGRNVRLRLSTENMFIAQQWTSSVVAYSLEHVY
jgi:hypothetical protein